MKRSKRPAGCCLALAVVAAAAPVRGELSLRSVPPLVHLQFRGPISIEGMTPLQLQSLPPGDYLLRASGLGLVTARGRIRSSLDNRVTLLRWASPLAVLVPPGTVHAARRDAWRGSMFTLAAAGGITGAIVKNAHHDEASGDLELAQDAYDQATSEAEIDRARLELNNAAAREEDEATMRALWIGYTAAVWVGTAVEAWLLTTPPEVQNGPAGEVLVRVPTARPLDAALRSAIVPGAGQRHMGHTWRGILFGASFYTLGAATISAYDEFLQVSRKQDDLQRRYDEATTTEELEDLRASLDDAANEVSDWKVTAWSLAGGTAAVYIWNILDAMGQGSVGWSRQGVQLGLAPRSDGVAARMTWRLP